MKVFVAEKCGFCFGVEHAIDLAQEMLAEGRNVYCFGDLIHNKLVVDRLMEAGMQVVNSLDEIPARTGMKKAIQDIPTVLIRSHGCRPELIEQIEKRGFQVADATCVLVKRAQNLVRELSQEGYGVIVVGDPDHPEVQGLIGYAPDVRVIAEEKDVADLPKGVRWAIVSQTTFSAEDFGHIIGRIAARNFKEIKVLNTICRETTRRQHSAIELCRQVEVMFVVGSLHSANTKELAQICQRQDVETYHLQNWQEFKPLYVEDKTIAGVTAGASTPDTIIQEFVNHLRQM